VFILFQDRENNSNKCSAFRVTKKKQIQRLVLDQKNGKLYDYYFCRHTQAIEKKPNGSTEGERLPNGSTNNELERWNDKMCITSAEKLNCCRTCAVDLRENPMKKSVSRE